MHPWLLRALSGVLFLSAIGHASAIGIAAIKDQSFHEDTSAKTFVYQEMFDEGAPFIKFKTTAKDITLDRGKVTATVNVPIAVPESIKTPEDLAPLRTSLADLNAFTKRFPQSAPLLTNHIAALTTNISRFEKGDVRHRGQWLGPKEYAAVLATQQKQNEGLHFENQAAIARLNAARIEREKFAAAQRAKGLEEYNGRWIPKADVAKTRQRDYESTAALEMIALKTIRKSVFTIYQVIDDGHLINVQSGLIKQGGINSSIVFLHGAALGSAGEGDTYRGDLFWAGTYSYTGGDGNSRTVNAYALRADDALNKTLISLRMGPKNSAVAASNESPKAPELNPIFEGIKASGSGFFIGTNGYFVTNAHVVKDAKNVEIYLAGKAHKATVTQIDDKLDLALLKSELPIAGLEILPSDVDTGEDIYTIGFPRPTLQGTEVKITKGIISSQKGLHDDAGFYQLDASMQPGNSGGPVCDTKGRLVGVVSSMLDQIAVAQASGSIPQNVNYAIKGSTVVTFLKANRVLFNTAVSSAEPPQGSLKTATAATAMVLVK